MRPLKAFIIVRPNRVKEGIANDPDKLRSTPSVQLPGGKEASEIDQDSDPCANHSTFSENINDSGSVPSELAKSVRQWHWSERM